MESTTTGSTTMGSTTTGSTTTGSTTTSKFDYLRDINEKIFN